MADESVRSQEWYLDAMDAEAMWKVSDGDGVKVAVIDSGVSDGTPSLKGQVLADETPKSVAYHATEDYDGHGTTIAELIAGTGAGGGIKGLAPGAKVVPYRVLLTSLKDQGERKKTPEMAKAVRAAADTDAKIINLSVGQDVLDPELESAVKYAHAKGKLMFAAVGNNPDKNPDLIGYPAAYDGVVGVAASDDEGKVGKFSQHGAFVDLAAPGLDIPRWCDATLTSYCGKGEGTSASAAIASGSAALIWSKHPDWTANQVLRVLTDTAARSWPADKPSTYLGHGLVRPARNLLHNEGRPGAAEVDPITNEKTTGAGSSSETTPSTSASGSSQPSQKPSDVPAEAAGSDAESSSDSNTLWIALGAVAAVIVIGGGGFAVLRARRGQ
ncbi:S8 family serine peptidase [Streptomyces sp. SID5785]|nr:S8 family serine peptidase [Streptomyces sp. SID5785]